MTWSGASNVTGEYIEYIKTWRVKPTMHSCEKKVSDQGHSTSNSVLSPPRTDKCLKKLDADNKIFAGKLNKNWDKTSSDRKFDCNDKWNWVPKDGPVNVDEPLLKMTSIWEALKDVNERASKAWSRWQSFPDYSMTERFRDGWSQRLTVL